jgi:bifunctional non-homologous end joining protein LigD
MNGLFEVKWDGYRAISVVEEKTIRIFSRNGLLMNLKFQPLVNEMEQWNLASAIFDGEIVVVDGHGVPKFELLQNHPRKREGHLLYYITLMGGISPASH